MSQGQNRKEFEDAFEVVLDGIPEVLSPIINTVASELEFEGWKYSVYEDEDISFQSSAYVKLIVGVIKEHKVEKSTTYSRDCIGIITLQLLPGNQTLFRIPPRQQWYARMEKDFYVEVNSSFLTEFLTHLFTEFQRLAFVDLKEKKTSIGFKPYRQENV